jgi:hypothetical protein
LKHHVAALSLLLTTFGLAGCAGAAAGPSPAPPSASASATATAPAAGTPTPAPAAACRLPVASGDAPTDGNAIHGAQGHGGFLQLPQGTFAADPASLAAYVLGAHAWVPVPRAWVSPDGRSYAYPEYRTASGPATGIIHVIDIASGADHPLGVPAPSMPISWEAAGIYVARVIPNSGAPPAGLSLLTPATGALRQITAAGAWTLIAGNRAVGADIDSSVALPPGGEGPGAANRVRLLDLDTGATSVQGTYPATNVLLLGSQGANLLLGLITSDHYTVKLGSSVLYEGAVTAPQPGSPAVVDGSTIWLSGPGAVWRSVNGAALDRLPVAEQLAVAAGACR